MGRVGRRLGRVVLLAFSVTVGVGDDVRATHWPTVLTTAPGPQGSPRTTGATVVWIDGRTGQRLATDIYGAGLSDRREFPVATGPAIQTQPDIDGSMVVWSESNAECLPCQFDIRGKDLANGQEFAVAATPAEETLPAISGAWVIWLSREGAVVTLNGRDLRSTAAPVTLAQVRDALVDRPEIDGDRVVWGEQIEGPDGAWRLLTQRIGAGEPAVVAQSAARGAQLFGYDLRGDLAVYAADGQLIAVHLRTGERRLLAVADASLPTTDGRYVFWQDGRFVQAAGGRRVDLRGYDLVTDSAFPVSINTGRNVLPHTDGGVLTWMRGFDPAEIDVHAAPVADLLPSARRPDPGATSPDWSYFRETGHYLALGFMTFWDRSGGLPAFGYSLTEEFDEQNPDTRQVYTVQYLERQRFEYHPEHRGTPYEILLGRLGAADAARRGLSETPPFRPLPADTRSDTTCTFFPETGHRLCAGFRAYWQSHGLEFGDPGISFREALALFGYPISEEFIDPDTGLTVQYTERAVFEYHPNNPDPYKVLLKRLGADLLAQRGW